MKEARSDKPIPLVEASFAAGCSTLTLRRAIRAKRIPVEIEWPRRRYVMTPKAIESWVRAGRPVKPLTVPSSSTTK